MASKGKVVLTFAGDSKDLEKAFDRVGQSAQTMSDEVNRATRSMGDGSYIDSGRVAESFDRIDQSAMGFRDGITGIQDSQEAWSNISGQTTEAVEEQASAMDKAVAKHKKLSSELDGLEAKQQGYKDRLRELKQLDKESLTEGQVAEIKRLEDASYDLGKEIKLSSEAVKSSGDASKEAGRELEALEKKQLGVMDTAFLAASGVGDLASSVVNLGVPMAQAVKWVSALSVAQTKNAATATASAASSAASTVAAVATQVAAWIVLGVQSLISAAAVAAAWLLSIWPIALVIVAVVALGVLIYKNWEKIKTVISKGWDYVKNVSAKVWAGIKAVVMGAIKVAVGYVKFQINVVKGIFRTLRSAISAIMSGVARAITAPFRKGFGAIRGIWNRAIGGKGFTVPDWVPGVGGRAFNIPKLAKGGLVKHSPGGVLANISEGGKDEAVIPLDRLERMLGVGNGSGAPAVVVNVSGSIVSERDIIDIVREATRRGSL